MDGAHDRLRREAENDLALAHTTASFHRAKKLERLDRYLKRKVEKPVGSLLDRLKVIAARTKRD